MLTARKHKKTPAFTPKSGGEIKIQLNTYLDESPGDSCGFSPFRDLTEYAVSNETEENSFPCQQHSKKVEAFC